MLKGEPKWWRVMLSQGGFWLLPILTIIGLGISYFTGNIVDLDDENKPLNSLSHVSSPCGEKEDIWSQCRNNDECMVGLNECGFKRSYNKRFHQTVQNYNRCVAPMISCVNPGQDPNKNIKEAVCVESRCFLSQN